MLRLLFQHFGPADGKNVKKNVELIFLFRKNVTLLYSEDLGKGRAIFE